MNEGGLHPVPIPRKGSVLGVDVGFSATRRSSAVCRLDWDDRLIEWTIRRFRAQPAEQAETISAVAGNRRLEAAAFDGPLRAGFDVIGRYRTADRMLTRCLGSKIGKPGQASAPVGKQLNAAANACVQVMLRDCRIGPAAHSVKIDMKAVVEAFPTAFLGVMLRDPSSLGATRRDRSDIFFSSLAETGSLRRLMTHLLPGRAPALSFDGVTNHDDRAALVSALTALCVAAGDFTAVGDADGWMILPPRLFTRSWARADLEANARDEERKGCYYRSAQQSAALDIPVAI
jgi:hypothetical protein